MITFAKTLCAAAALVTLAAMPVAARAQAAYDGIYTGVSATLRGTMSGHRANGCPASFKPRPLTLSSGRAHTRWTQADMDGTVSPQGAIVMHSSLSGRLDAQIDAQGAVQGTYNGACIYSLTWQKTR